MTKKRAKFKRNRTEIKVDQVLLENRQVLLYGEINEELVLNVSKQLLALSCINNKPIVMFINSPGGDVAGGLALIDMMQRITSSVTTIINGEACSIAGLISVVGDKRLMTKNSIWMAHPMSGGMGTDYFHYYKDRMKGLELYVNILKKVLKEHTKLSKEEIESAEHGELWLTAIDAKKKKIVDQVI